MNFHLSSEQQMLQDSVRRYLENTYAFETRLSKIKAGHDGDNTAWLAFADAGWLAAALPEEHDGLGGSIIDTALIAHEFGRALVVEPYLGCAVLGAQTLLAAATDAQRADLVPAAANGSRITAVAYSESQSRGLPGPIATVALPVETGYQLTGCKTLVLGGLEATQFIVSARVGPPQAAAAEQTLFLVEANSPGLERQALRLHDGSWAAKLTFDQMSVGHEAVLGEIGSGLGALKRGMIHAMVAICSELVGCMERSIELTADYLKIRKQFGVTIGSFQALQHRMADMATELEVSRSMLFSVMASIGEDPVDRQWAAACESKALIARAAKLVCGQAIQLHGGIGMTEEYAIGHYFKRAVVADILFGSSDWLYSEVAWGARLTAIPKPASMESC
jgi:alkylation response protein AidB-like acyl-CoA dehydrogenase